MDIFKKQNGIQLVGVIFFTLKLDNYIVIPRDLLYHYKMSVILGTLLTFCGRPILQEPDVSIYAITEWFYAHYLARVNLMCICTE